MGGAWVFPGGSVSAEDGEGAAALRAAAVRELAEEVGVQLPAGAELVAFSNWITPAEVRIRFDTWFFLAVAPEGAEPEVDGSEIVDARWFEPALALAAAEREEIMLVFPTIKHLEQISRVRVGGRAGGLCPPPDRAPGAAAGRRPGGGEKARIVLPGEPGYDDCPATRPAGTVRPREGAGTRCERAGGGPAPARAYLGFSGSTPEPQLGRRESTRARFRLRLKAPPPRPPPRARTGHLPGAVPGLPGALRVAGQVRQPEVRQPVADRDVQLRELAGPDQDPHQDQHRAAAADHDRVVALDDRERRRGAAEGEAGEQERDGQAGAVDRQQQGAAAGRSGRSRRR